MFAPYRIAEGRDFEAVGEARTGHGYTIPAPIGGLNGRDSLANMPETDAIILDNFFPQPSWVEVRGGKKALALLNGNTENCDTLAAYGGLAGSQLYAAANKVGTRSLYRVDNLAGGAVGAPVVGGAGNTVQAITSTFYSWTMFATTAGNFLYLVNGVDNPLLFDGTTWFGVSTSSVPYALTGTTPSLLSDVADYHGMLFFIQGNSFNVWWLASGTVAGALNQLPLGAYFQLGGSLVAIATMSIDNSLGTNDYIAFISSVGEVVVFQGSNPASISTFALAAHFRIGRPIGTGRKCWQKFGSDVAVITADGVVLLSQALLTDRSQSRNAITDKVRRLIYQDIKSYAANQGWQLLLYPFGTKLIVNVPTTQDQASYAYVMNTLSGAWCTFGRYASPWNAFCFEVMGDGLYFGTAGAVYQGDFGGDDAGSAIQGLAKQAFSYFGEKGLLKRWTMARPVVVAGGTISIGLTLVTDFNNALPVGAIPISQGNAAPWNTSLWTTPTYWGDALIISKEWLGIGGLGYNAAPILQVAALDVTFQWQSTDYVFEEAGLT